MTAYGTEFFSMNDVNRLRIRQDVIDRRFTTCLAATRLEISDRHCRRLLERYREHGPLSLVGSRIVVRPPSSTLLVYVDDATSRLMQLLFVSSESTFAYFEATRCYLKRYDKPLAFYSDKASVFRINNKHATGGDGQTQFGRAMNELNITGICANTSSAKGRVERAHLTLQDRLVKELRLRGISTPEAANAFAEEFMADYNRRFAKPPRHDFYVHRPLDNNENLEATFTWREQRKAAKNLTLQYDKKLNLLEDNEENRRFQVKYIDVWQYPDGTIELRG
ncbi:hypothetical protein SP99_04576 [Enterobacter sp. BIDMC92]|nr:hypothetical protein SP99_04576 [Enterobacter sp. BIDMC92]